MQLTDKSLSGNPDEANDGSRGCGDQKLTPSRDLVDAARVLAHLDQSMLRHAFCLREASVAAVADLLKQGLNDLTVAASRMMSDLTADQMIPLAVLVRTGSRQVQLALKMLQAPLNIEPGRSFSLDESGAPLGEEPVSIRAIALALGDRERRILRHVVAHNRSGAGELYQVDIQVALSISKGTASHALKRLEHFGLIERGVHAGPGSRLCHATKLLLEHSEELL